MGYLQAFERSIAVRQSRELEDDCLNQLRGEAEPIRLPGGRAARVSLHGWLIRYDLNKYIHIVLLHDHMESFYRNGLSTPLRYPEPQRASLEQHLQAIATYCRSRPNCAEGMTLIVLGGLGGEVLSLLDNETGM